MKKISRKKHFIFLVVMIVACFYAYSTYSNKSSTKEREVKEEVVINLQEEFKGYDGCFIMYDEQLKTDFIYSVDKIDRRVSPYSTFKIANSLIALELGIIEDKDHLYVWNGEQYPLDNWNKDHTLETAMQDSVVWYYQEVAKNIGEEQMKSYLDMFEYGNKDISGGIEMFWLDSTFKVSPREQVDLLFKLQHDILPVSTENSLIVREIIMLDKQEDYIFSGKTGTGEDGGWFIGTLQEPNNILYFATYIEGGAEATGAQAKHITLEILESVREW